MAKSLRSKRMRRNRALQAEKKAPRVLKRLKDNLDQAKKFNVRYNLYRVKSNAPQKDLKLPVAPTPFAHESLLS